MDYKMIPVTGNKFEGYVEQNKLPVKAGDIVVIPKGIKIKNLHTGFGVTKRAYKVKVHHVLPGSAVPLYLMPKSEREELGIKRENYTDEQWYHSFYPLTNPKICWPGTSGYWSEVDLNDILDVNSIVEAKAGV